jgi:uncharacterized protein
MKEEVVLETADYIKQRLSGEGSGHDWWHIYRVWNLGKKIAALEKANLYVVELACLLHDIADYKFHGGDEEIGPRLAEEWLKKLSVEKPVINHITKIISDVSFKGANTENKINTLEGQCVQDADRLDAIGAVGIARCFAYGGFKGRLIYDPSVSPNINMSKEEYKRTDSSAINHFYEKLLLLKDMMNTNTGKKLAEERHEFMELFLKQFYKEWDIE